MYRAKRIETDDKPLFYRTLTHLLEQLLEDETDRTAPLRGRPGRPQQQQAAHPQ